MLLGFTLKWSVKPQMYRKTFTQEEVFRGVATSEVGVEQLFPGVAQQSVGEDKVESAQQEVVRIHQVVADHREVP